ncbi:MAG: sigma-70 family RNA polymerase sigma factor [Lachnospiraceae bacterium]|nr:sigma-70 family RNA polymerase sigma factor [Lachnospiraceae bacterium]
MSLFFGVARKILNNSEDAEDAVHTCFLKIAEIYERYRHQPNENMIRLGCTVVRHAAIDMVREKEMKMTFTDETFSWEDSVPDVILEGNEYECLR